MEFREQGAGKDDLPAGIRFSTAHDVGAGRRKESVVTKQASREVTLVRWEWTG